MLVDTTSSLGDESSLTQSSTEGSKRSSTIPSADDILVEMIQSGRYTHNQVVHFCLASGIPLSRMLRLDLMRLNKASDTNDLPMDSI
jgi:hypothetical protein